MEDKQTTEQASNYNNLEKISTLELLTNINTEDTLFPKNKNRDNNTIIAAPGTSRRYQIKDGTQQNSKYPVSI